MKKRFLAILMVATLTLSLSACGGKADKDTGSDDAEAKNEMPCRWKSCLIFTPICYILKPSNRWEANTHGSKSNRGTKRKIH